MKRNRQKAVLRIIEEQKISTQEQLRAALAAEGFDVTQATLSRDMAELGIEKDERGYRAASPGSSGMHEAKSVKILAEAVRKIDSAANIVVVKTLPGMGSAAGAALDHLAPEQIIGSVARDDTVVMIAGSERDAQSARSYLSELV